jgi:hypothetical protein
MCTAGVRAAAYCRVSEVKMSNDEAMLEVILVNWWSIISHRNIVTCTLILLLFIYIYIFMDPCIVT